MIKLFYYYIKKYYPIILLQISLTSLLGYSLFVRGDRYYSLFSEMFIVILYVMLFSVSTYILYGVLGLSFDKSTYFVHLLPLETYKIFLVQIVFSSLYLLLVYLSFSLFPTSLKDALLGINSTIISNSISVPTSMLFAGVINKTLFNRKYTIVMILLILIYLGAVFNINYNYYSNSLLISAGIMFLVSCYLKDKYVNM